MALVFQTTDTIGPGTPISLETATSDDLFVLGGVTVGSTTSTAVQGLGTSHDVMVLGTVSGAASGIKLGDNSGLDNTNAIRIGKTGFVYGGTFGVEFASFSSQLTNDGAIMGDGIGVKIGGISPLGSKIVNTGLITGGNSGITVTVDATESVDLCNEGTIQGASAYTGAANAIDSIQNRGVMIGKVSLFYGDDLFDNRFGRVEGDISGGDGTDTIDLRDGFVSGAIYGDEGNDIVLPGAQAETIDGGAGADTLDFRGSAGLRVSLADESSTGLAEGDVYVGFEIVLGSRSGADTLIGDTRANTLRGFGGSDVISGGTGNDTLEGGAGADRLTGGAGNDSFRYFKPTEGGDTITDFGNSAENDDNFKILASGFGGGLVAGTTLAASQFQSRADNLAQDANDRFIFRTTDKTLWYDANGSAVGGLTLLATLQAGAVVTHQDILII